MRSHALIAASLLSLAPGLARADVAEEPTEENYDCSIEESCPDSGVLCDSDPCFEDQQCPSTGVECDWRDDDNYEECMTGAEAAGLQLRCDDQSTVYCDAGEAAPVGSVAECHAKQKAAGLSKRCEDEDFNVIYCDAKEESPTADGGEASSGCTVESPHRRGSGLGVALVVFGVTATAAALRARKRRAG